MKNVLIMCHGNVNRSALCGAILHDHLEVPAFTVKSAGFLKGGKRAAKKMRKRAELLGYNLEEHRSTELTKDLALWADVVVIMDNGNKKRLDNFVEEHSLQNQVHLTHPVWLHHFAKEPQKHKKVPDPAFFAKDSLEFSNTVTLIYECSLGLIKHLEAMK